MTAPVNIQWTPKGGGTTDISSSVDWTSIEMTSVITKERGTLQFTIKSTHWANLPAISDDIKLYDPSGVIFGGVVTEIESTQTKQEGGLLLEAQVTVTDYGFVLDCNIVKTAYANMDAADIVANLVTQFGPGGFDVTTYVQRGLIVSTISFNYQPLTKCIQALATLIGWDWYIDPAKKLHFFYATTQSGSSEYNPAPITIDDTSGGLEWNSIDIDVSISNMKNAVYVIGGTYEINFVDSPLPNQNPPELAVRDLYTTDGVKSVYPLGYRYGSSSITVFLDGSEQSCGIDLQDNPADYEVMYNTNGSFLIFPSPPSSGQTLKVEGLAEVPIVAFVSNRASIATYGQIADVITDSQITSVAQAQARGQAEITMYGHPVYTVKFNTIATGLRVGQIILLNSAKYGVSNYPLVIKEIQAEGFTPLKLRYQVQAIGSDVVTYNDMMMSLLLQASQSTTVDPSTILQVLLDDEETILVDDSATISATTGPYLVGTARVGFSKVS